MLYCFFRWAVDDFRKQAVSLIQPYEFQVIRDNLLIVLVRRGVILLRAVFVQQITITVLPELVLAPRCSLSC